MRKLILGTIMLASLAAAAAQQPAENNHSHMQMMTMQNCPMTGGMMGSVDVKYEATENGARLTFTPKDPAKLSELQTKIREMAERMGQGGGSGMMRNYHGGATNEFSDGGKTRR